MLHADLSHRDLVRSLFSDVWMDQKYELAESYFTPKASIEGAVGVPLGAAEYGPAVAQISQFGKMREMEILDTFESPPDRAAFHTRVTLEAVRTGSVAQYEMALFVTFEDGRIAHMVTVMDLLTFIEKAGLVPEGFRMGLLAGEDVM